MTAMLFEHGRIIVTPGALKALELARWASKDLLGRHLAGDWGDMDAHDKAVNDRALRTGGRLFSTYKLPAGTELLAGFAVGTLHTIWVITEADRSITTLLLPEDY